MIAHPDIDSIVAEAVRREEEVDPALTLIHGRLVVVIGGQLTRFLRQLHPLLMARTGGRAGPFEFAVIDAAKELDTSLLNGMSVKLIYIPPLSLNRLRELIPWPQFVAQHMDNRQVPAQKGSPGSGSMPILGFLYALMQLPNIDSDLGQMLGRLVHPRTAAQTEEDVHLGARKFDPTRLHVNFFYGHGGTSSLAAFPVAACLRERLAAQGRPVHICARFVLASGHACLDEGAQPTVHRNTAVSMAVLDARQSGSPMVANEIVLMDGARIRPDGPRLFDETILYGQRPGEKLNEDEFARAMAEAYVHELVGKAGICLLLRELDFRNTLAGRRVNGKLTHHSAIGCREVTAVPGDVRGRFAAVIQSRMLSLERSEGSSAGPAEKLAGEALGEAGLLREDFGGDLSEPPGLPALHRRMQVKEVQAAHTRLTSQLDHWVRQGQAALDKEIAGPAQRSAFCCELRGRVQERPVAHQVGVYQAVIARCGQLAAAAEGRARQRDQAYHDAHQRDTYLMGRPARSDEWVQEVQSAWQELAASAGGAWHRAWAAHLGKIAAKLQPAARRLTEMLRAVEGASVRIPSPTTERPSILSIHDLTDAAAGPIEEALRRFRRRMAREAGDGAAETVVAEALQRLGNEIEQDVLEQYGSVARAMCLLHARGQSVLERLDSEIDATQPMLTADEELMTGYRLHVTTVVSFPEGTKDELTRAGIDLGNVQRATLVEDRVDNLVILRAFRGYAASVIPEIARGVEELYKTYEAEPNAHPPWPHLLDAIPMPVLPRREELNAATLFARLMAIDGLGNAPTFEQRDGAIWLCNGAGDVRLAGDDEDVLAGVVAAIRSGKIDGDALNAKIDRYYEQHADDNEAERLLRVARENLNKARGPDYVTTMKVHSAIDYYLTVRSRRNVSRNDVYGTTGSRHTKE